MAITKFKFYGYNGYKKGRCAVCKKYGGLQQRFEQSINPWNKKTPEQIWSEEKTKLDFWKTLPFIHRKCERA